LGGEVLYEASSEIDASAIDRILEVVQPRLADTTYRHLERVAKDNLQDDIHVGVADPTRG
jgi:hypothetical protein